MLISSHQFTTNPTRRVKYSLLAGFISFLGFIRVGLAAQIFAAQLLVNVILPRKAETLLDG